MVDFSIPIGNDPCWCVSLSRLRSWSRALLWTASSAVKTSNRCDIFGCSHGDLERQLVWDSVVTTLKIAFVSWVGSVSFFLNKKLQKIIYKAQSLLKWFEWNPSLQISQLAFWTSSRLLSMDPAGSLGVNQTFVIRRHTWWRSSSAC